MHAMYKATVHQNLPYNPANYKEAKDGGENLS